MAFLQEHAIVISDQRETPFLNAIDIYQDGTTPMWLVFLRR